MINLVFWWFMKCQMAIYDTLLEYFHSFVSSPITISCLMDGFDGSINLKLYFNGNNKPVRISCYNYSG
ncbi:hypothetical protein Leryth_025196 [Lithospermum erythrorhizon]|nr:hypothetical protein Leryth_025196 [Lithospermum erythrorhizon]